MEFELDKVNFNLYPYYNNSYLNDVQSNQIHNINYFFEGITDEELFKNFRLINLYTHGTAEIVHQNNNIINYFNTNLNPYISYYIKNGKYIKEFNFDFEKNRFNTMIRGQITGNVNVKECGVTDQNKFSIYCYRSDDRQFIGEYKITNGYYNIPNLDVNSHYDLILVDHERKIEQNVLSYRTPIETQVPNILSSIPEKFEIVYRNNYFNLSYDIYRSLYHDYEYVRLVYLGVDGLSYEIIQDKIYNNQLFQRELQYGQYKLESVYKDNISSSNIFNLSDAQEINIVIPNTTYNPPIGDNINIIGN